MTVKWTLVCRYDGGDDGEYDVLSDPNIGDAEREHILEDVGSDQWDHTKIQVSMRGSSNGSKFVRHHAGD